MKSSFPNAKNYPSKLLLNEVFKNQNILYGTGLYVSNSMYHLFKLLINENKVSNFINFRCVLYNVNNVDNILRTTLHSPVKILTEINF